MTAGAPGWRKIRRTVLRDRRSSRLISCSERPCSRSMRTLLLISIDFMTQPPEFGVHLGQGRAHAAEVSIVPSIGNLAYEFKVHGKNALWFPFRSLAEFKAKPAL